MTAKQEAQSPAAHPGILLEQAVGEMMGKSLAARMLPLANKYGCHYVGLEPDPSAKRIPLRLQDRAGVKYHIDALVATSDFQPLVLMESKCVARNKHNCDKGGLICRVHQSLRERFYGVPKSVVVLAGGWTQSSVAMIQSAQADVFLVPYEKTSALLAAQGVDFDWGEKDRDMAVHAWMTYDKLPLAAKHKIAEDMIADIGRSFSKTIDLALQSDAKPEIKDIVVEFHATTGEMRREHFDSVEEAAFYLNNANAADIFDFEGALTMLAPVNDKDAGN